MPPRKRHHSHGTNSDQDAVAQELARLRKLEAELHRSELQEAKSLRSMQMTGAVAIVIFGMCVAYSFYVRGAFVQRRQAISEVANANVKHFGVSPHSKVAVFDDVRLSFDVKRWAQEQPRLLRPPAGSSITTTIWVLSCRFLVRS